MDEFWLWWLCVSAGLFASGFILGKMVKMDNRNGIFPHQLRRHEGAPSQVAREGSKNKAEESSSYSKALVKHLPPLPAGMFVFLSTYGLNSEKTVRVFREGGIHSIRALQAFTHKELVDKGLGKEDAAKLVQCAHQYSPDGKLMRPEGAQVGVVKRRGYRRSAIDIFPPESEVPLLEGKLKKKASGSFGGWQERWFQVSGAYLQYFGDKKRTQLLAAIDLRLVLSIGERPDSGRAGEFQIVLESRKYRLDAGSREEATSWVDGLLKRQRALWGLNQNPDQGIELERSKAGEREENAESKRRSKIFGAKLSLTSFQKRLVKQLRQIVQDFAKSGQGFEIGDAVDGWNDARLLRFLVARDMDVIKAGKMLLQSLKWRAMNVPLISIESIRKELSKGKYRLLGRDRRGNVVIFIDSKKMGKHTYSNPENMAHGIIWCLEGLCNHVLGETGRVTVLYSLAGASFKNHDLHWAKTIGKILADNYPETLSSAIVVPASFAFRSVWNVAKVFFDAKTASKIRFLANHSRVFDLIDPDIVPICLGGRSTSTFNVNELLYPEQLIECEGGSCHAAASSE